MNHDWEPPAGSASGDRLDSVAEYLSRKFAFGDADMMTDAIGAIILAWGLPDISRRSQVSESCLLQTFGSEGKPSLALFVQIIRSLGLQLQVSVRRNPDRIEPKFDSE